MPVVFDIATKVVSPQQRIWAVFPGTARKFFRAFATQSLIFLDTPALNLTASVLADDNLLRQHVAMSIAWGAYYYSPDGKKVPSRNPSDYPVQKDASVNAAVANVRHTFRDMKDGDLVLVGAYSQYDSVLIGEVVGDFDPDVFIHYERYENARIPARKVRWLRMDFERRHLSSGLSQLLSSRKAVVSVPKPVYGEEIYTVAYGDYVYGEQSRYIYEGRSYRNIGLAILPGLNLLSYFIAAYNACEIGELEQFAAMNIDEAVQNYFEQDILNSFEVDFHSPGEYVLHAKRAALPLLVAVLVTATAGHISLTEARAAEVTNSAAAPAAQHAVPDGCSPVEIQEKYRAIMISLGAERYNQLCKLNKEAQEGVGLTANVKQKVENKK